MMIRADSDEFKVGLGVMFTDHQRLATYGELDYYSTIVTKDSGANNMPVSVQDGLFLKGFSAEFIEGGRLYFDCNYFDWE